jgi:predicted amidohydrolase
MNQDQGRPPLRVALAQFKPRKADPRGNLERVRRILAEESPHADVVVFPEAALSGYFLEGGVAEAALTSEQLTTWLGPPPEGTADLVVGFYERWRRRLYNSVAYVEPQGDAWVARHVHRKIFLPTYGVFDEARFVEHGSDVRAFDTRFGRFGMLICEEAWHSLPATLLALDGAELVMVVSASPARDFSPVAGGVPANLDRWNRLAPAMAAEHGIFVVVAQLAGSEGGKLFPGGSIAVGPDGTILAHGPLLEEAVTIAALDAAAIDRARDASPLLSDLEQALPHL